MRDIYKNAVKFMKKEEIDHNNADLYLKVTPISKKLIEEYEFKENVEIFTDNIEKELWYDIPFAYANQDFKEKKNGSL